MRRLVTHHVVTQWEQPGIFVPWGDLCPRIIGALLAISCITQALRDPPLGIVGRAMRFIRYRIWTRHLDTLCIPVRTISSLITAQCVMESIRAI